MLKNVRASKKIAQLGKKIIILLKKFSALLFFFTYKNLLDLLENLLKYLFVAKGKKIKAQNI